MPDQNSVRTSEKWIDECIELVKNWRKYGEQFQVNEEKTNAIDAVLIKELK